MRIFQPKTTGWVLLAAIKGLRNEWVCFFVYRFNVRDGLWKNDNSVKACLFLKNRCCLSMVTNPSVLSSSSSSRTQPTLLYCGSCFLLLLLSPHEQWLREKVKVQYTMRVLGGAHISSSRDQGQTEPFEFVLVSEQQSVVPVGVRSLRQRYDTLHSSGRCALLTAGYLRRVKAASAI